MGNKATKYRFKKDILKLIQKKRKDRKKEVENDKKFTEN